MDLFKGATTRFKNKVVGAFTSDSPSERKDDEILLQLWSRGVDCIDSKNLHELNRLITSESSLVNYEGKGGDTLLHIAAGKGELEAAQLLVKHKADINHQNKDNRTPLIEATCSQFTLVTKFLLHKGANVSLYSVNRSTALYYVARRRDAEVKLVKSLVKHSRAYLDNVVNHIVSTSTPFMAILDFVQVPEVKQYLIDNGESHSFFE